MRHVIACAISALVFGVAAIASADSRTVVYVAPTGTNAVGRGTAEAPYATIRYAVTNNGAPLDVMVAAGTYKFASEPSITLNDDIRVIGANRDTTIATRSGLTEKPPFFKLTHKDAVVANMKLMDNNNGSALVSGVDVVSGTVSNLLFYNTCGGYNCGALRLNGPNARAYDCEVTQSHCWNVGPRSHVYVFEGRLERLYLHECWHGYSDGKGTGLYIEGTNAIVRNSRIKGISASGGTSRGTGVYIVKGVLENCTVYGCSNTGGDSAGVYVGGTNAIVRNCVITDNKTSAVASDLYGELESISYSYSPALEHGVRGNVTLDPQFIDPAHGDYHFTANSTCCNRGATNSTYADTPDLDFDHYPRRYNGSAPDIGCYELQQDCTRDPFTAEFVASKTVGQDTLATTFTAFIDGHTVSETAFTWDFGDGTEPRTVSGVSTVDHTYNKRGLFTVSLLCEADGDTCVSTNNAYIRVNSSECFVDIACATPSFPYDSPTNASKTLTAVWACRPSVMHVADGDYQFPAATTYFILDYPVSIIGESPANTRFHVTDFNKHKTVFTLTHPDALLASVRVTDVHTDSGTAAILVTSGTVSNVLVSSCGGISGGTMRLNGPNARAYDCEFSACKHWNSGNVGIVVVDEGLVDGLYVHGCSQTYSPSYGHALRVAGANAVVRNALIVNNSISGGNAANKGCGAYVKSGTLENCTIVGNSAKSGLNGGIYVETTSAAVRNCIAVSNTGAVGTAAPNVLAANADALACVTYCCSPDLADGVRGNTSAAPGFVTDSGFAYAIGTSSPCYNKGKRAVWMASGRDYLHRPRAVGSPDIGCYELQILANTIFVIR